MKHRTLLLLLVALAALSVGFLAGYRARVGQEVIKVYPLPMRPPVPDDLGLPPIDVRDIRSVLWAAHEEREAFRTLIEAQVSDIAARKRL